MDKIKIIPFNGSEEVAPDEAFVYSANSLTRMMNKLLKKYPNTTTFEVETEDGSKHIADYVVADGEIALDKEARRQEPAPSKKPTEVKTTKATKIEDLGGTEGTPAFTASDFSENDGPETNRRIQSDEELPGETGTSAPASATPSYERGLTTRTIIDIMEAGPCNRPMILEALKKTFPDKPEKVLKNSMGALVHATMKRKEAAGEWELGEIPDPDDKRKKMYNIKVIDKDAEQEPTEQAA
jgi:hypothetical protein